MQSPLIKFDLPHPLGMFGARRRHDIHTGIDLYCEAGSVVSAIESGVVVDVGPFTGRKVQTPWWHDTDFVAIAGESGIILYGEIKTNLCLGDKVEIGKCVGTVKTVLKKDKGLPMSMLHLELYNDKYNGHVFWYLDESKPESLMDSVILIKGLL